MGKAARSSDELEGATMDYEKAAKEIQEQLQPYFNEAHAALKRGDDKPANIYSCGMLSCVAAPIVVAHDKDERADALDAAIGFLCRQAAEVAHYLDCEQAA